MGCDSIVAAAIRYRTHGEVTPHVVTGRRHSDCISQFAAMSLPTSQRDMAFETQGFITRSGRFVDRKEALAIARDCGQLPNNLPASKTKLISEDLW